MYSGRLLTHDSGGDGLGASRFARTPATALCCPVDLWVPGGIVSDHGAVFRADDYVTILKALEIEPKYIELRKPWQNLIEAQFKVQLRLADFKFEQAGTVEEIQRLHAAFIETFNTTRHGAHQDRAESRWTPVDVLGWAQGRTVAPERLRRLFGGCSSCGP